MPLLPDTLPSERKVVPPERKITNIVARETADKPRKRKGPTPGILCTTCKTNLRRAKQRTCYDCHNAYERERKAEERKLIRWAKQHHPDYAVKEMT